MSHAEAAKAVFPSEFEAADHVEAIAARLDALEAEREKCAQRLARASERLMHANEPTGEIQAYAMALVIARAKTEATEECLRDALRSHGRLKAYSDALKVAR